MLNDDSAATGQRKSLHGHWSSRMAFILAVTGSAVGLGNIWKFPYIAGQNGGGAFVVVYLICVFLIGMPVMMSEILLGRRGRRNPVATMALLGEEEGGSRQWQWIGVLGVVAGILILSYYSVIAGWTLAYVHKSITGIFVGASATAVSAVFKEFTGSWVSVTVAHSIFMGINIFVVARGVERGLEKAVRFMVPALLLLMLTKEQEPGGGSTSPGCNVPADGGSPVGLGMLLLLGAPLGLVALPTLRRRRPFP